MIRGSGKTRVEDLVTAVAAGPIRPAASRMQRTISRSISGAEATDRVLALVPARGVAIDNRDRAHFAGRPVAEAASSQPSRVYAPGTRSARAELRSRLLTTGAF